MYFVLATFLSLGKKWFSSTLWCWDLSVSGSWALQEAGQFLSLKSAHSWSNCSIYRGYPLWWKVQRRSRRPPQARNKKKKKQTYSFSFFYLPFASPFLIGTKSFVSLQSLCCFLPLSHFHFVFCFWVSYWNEKWYSQIHRQCFVHRDESDPDGDSTHRTTSRARCDLR